MHGRRQTDYIVVRACSCFLTYVQSVSSPLQTQSSHRTAPSPTKPHRLRVETSAKESSKRYSHSIEHSTFNLHAAFPTSDFTISSPVSQSKQVLVLSEISTPVICQISPSWKSFRPQHKDWRRKCANDWTLSGWPSTIAPDPHHVKSTSALLALFDCEKLPRVLHWAAASANCG